jgi:hypothetical protein
MRNDVKRSWEAEGKKLGGWEAGKLKAQRKNYLSKLLYGRRRSRVQRFMGSGFHSRPRTAFEMRIYDKSVSFVRANP